MVRYYDPTSLSPSGWMRKIGKGWTLILLSPLIDLFFIWAETSSTRAGCEEITPYTEVCPSRSHTTANSLEGWCPVFWDPRAWQQLCSAIKSQQFIHDPSAFICVPSGLLLGCSCCNAKDANQFVYEPSSACFGLL